MSERPLIVGIGGTTRRRSTSECGLRLALEAAEQGGARTVCFDGAFLAGLPPYAPDHPHRTDDARRMVETVRAADGIVLATPAYHAGISGLVKNALDYLEDLRADDRPYLDGRAVGCVVAAQGQQAIGTTLAALRAVVHALRGWPTPLGVGLDTTRSPFGADGVCADPEVDARLSLVGLQVAGFAAARPRAAIGVR
jgi:FMN reductase